MVPQRAKTEPGLQALRYHLTMLRNCHTAPANARAAINPFLTSGRKSLCGMWKIAIRLPR